MLWGKLWESEKPAVAGNQTQDPWLELPTLYHQDPPTVDDTY